MNPLRLLAFVAALVAAPAALAQQHDHAGAKQSPAAAAGIAEGTLTRGVRTFDLAVTDDGFVPARLVVSAGEKVRLVVTRRTDATCAKEIVVEGKGVTKALPLGKAVAVEFVAGRSGEIRFACAMGHVAGVVFVK